MESKVAFRRISSSQRRLDTKLDFHRCNFRLVAARLSEKLLVYALGRPVEGTDREAIDNVVAAAKRDGATLRSMIQNIAATKAFQTKTTAAY